MCPRSGDTQPVKTQPVRVVPSAVSDEPARGALGHLIAVYRPHPPSQVMQWTWLVGGAVTVLSFLGYGIFQAFSNQARFGVIPAVTRSAGWITAGTILMLVWLLVILYCIYKRQPTIRLYAQGLYIEARQPMLLHWEQIDGIASGARKRRDWFNGKEELCYSAFLSPTQGRSIHLHGSSDGKRGIPELPELIRRIKANLYPGLYPELLRMFRSGLPLNFGLVAIDKRGLQLRSKIPLVSPRQITWQNVKRITVQSGYFLVESDHRPRRGYAHPTYRLAVAQIPNLELLLKIIDQGIEA